MPTSDIEVFEYLRSDNETPLEIDYLTYAVFAYKKQQWCAHFRAQSSDTAPTQAQIDNWISQLSDYDFEQVRNEAVDFFHTAAEVHLHDYIEQQKKEAIDQSIVGVVREYTSPSRHILIALGMALVAPIALGGLIFFISLFDSHFPIHVTFGADRAAQSSTPPAAANTLSTGAKPGDAPPPKR
jgi:hypothetical protein